MAAIDDLLKRVDDPALRDALTREFLSVRDDKQFGLVFERHLPESVRLPGHPVRKGLLVEERGEKDSPRWTVRKVSKGQATISRSVDKKMVTETRPVEELVAVRQFGEPIYPGLKSIDKIERGGDKPWHSVINAENYHALEALRYSYAGQVDCIYLDPPYNSGARDWKYNNDYVDGEDAYRHSKWLSFMEKRLRLAKTLLNSEDSVLIATIDEKEYLRLGLLLEEVFPETNIQMVSIVINPKGTARYNEFSRVEEYAFFVFIGSARLQVTGSDMLTNRDYASETDVRWRGLARTGRKGLRPNNPGSWYPIFLNNSDGSIHSIGDAIPMGVSESTVDAPTGTTPAWPPTKDGHQYSWSVVPETLRSIQSRGGLKTGNVNLERGSYPFYYLSSGAFEKIDRGEILIKGRGKQGEVIVEFAEGLKSAAPRSVWNQVSHDAGSHGTGLLQKLLPGRKFPFPKSLYAVEDCLRFFTKSKPDALVLDFFGGSGTTCHAVARLNRQDGGRRQSIVVTNNEVSEGESAVLRAEGHCPGQPEWESQGIFEYVTKPRVTAAITGRSPEGEAILGDYKFIDEFPIGEGFAENIEFLELTYEDRDRVSLGAAFEAIAPLLWMRAGAVGPRIDKREGSWALPEKAVYGVLFGPAGWRDFVNAVNASDVVSHAFIVTDSNSVFQQVVRELPPSVEPVRLYENYLDSFEINTGGIQ